MELIREKIIPHLKTKKAKLLYSSNGNVYSIYTFANKYLNKLTEVEQNIILNSSKFLSKKKYFEYPIIGTKEADNKISKPIEVKSIGSRSALIENKNVKLKGCVIDTTNQLCFPHESLPFGSEKMVTTEIPFGVLTQENVLKEILAYCFFQQHSLNTIHKPISVFEYIYNEKVIGYCLVSKTKTEKRLESTEYHYGLTLKELIYIKTIEQRLHIQLTENEPDFGIDKKWYAKQKSKLLIKMNFNGGFRGVLNSNMGNDILYENKLYICDFDTFSIIKMPLRPGYEFIRNFILWCIIELLKTSPIVLDYLDTNGLTSFERTKQLWKIYTTKSLLWKNYQKFFIKKANDLKWNPTYIEKAFQEIIQTKVFQEMILDNVINSKIIKESYPAELSFYTQH